MRRLALVVPFLTMALMGCDGYTVVHGRVSNPQGQPVKGAAVKLTQQRADEAARVSTADTDEDGKYRVGTSHASSKTMPFTFEISKSGFEPYKEKLLGSANLARDVTLKPAKE